MTEQTDVRELRERLKGDAKLWASHVKKLREFWGDHSDTHYDAEETAALLNEAAAALERLETLEDELRLCRSFHEVAVRQRDSAWAEARSLRAYYEAAEQAEYAGRQLGTAAQAQAARRLEIARAALRATPAPAAQTGGEA